MNVSILDRVRQIASDVFGMPLDRISRESSPSTIDAWDSLQHLNLVLALEQEFSVQLEPQDIEQMRSIDSAVKFVERMQKQADKG
jgi:acyl carrier protein